MIYFDTVTKIVSKTFYLLFIGLMTRGRLFIQQLKTHDALIWAEFTELFQVIQGLTAAIGNN